MSSLGSLRVRTSTPLRMSGAGTDFSRIDRLAHSIREGYYRDEDGDEPGQEQDARSLSRRLRSSQSKSPFTDTASADEVILRRTPPIDPRKARRHCTDFGIARTSSAEVLSRPPLRVQDSYDSSVWSTPLGTYTATESDSSSFRDLQYDFPQPPPISPVLRHMKSSPLFTVEDTTALRDLYAERRSTMALPYRVPTSQHLPHVDLTRDYAAKRSDMRSKTLEHKVADLPPREWTTYKHIPSKEGKIDRLSRAQDYEMEGETLMQIDLDRHNMRRTHASSKSASSGLDRRHGLQSTNTASHNKTSAPKHTISARNSSAPPRDILSAGRMKERSVGPSAFQAPRTPMVIRRITSLRTSPKQDRPGAESPRFSGRLTKMRSLKFAVESRESLERNDTNMEKRKPRRSLLRGRSISMEFHFRKPSQASAVPPAPPRPPFSSVNPSRQKTSHRSNLSVPFFSRSDSRTSQHAVAPQISGGHASLPKPFSHRSARSQPINVLSSKEEELVIPAFKSFIDITPEHIRQENWGATNKRRIRKLMARASTVVGWSKGLAKKM